MRNTAKLSLLQFTDIGPTTIPHTSTKPSNILNHHFRQISFERYSSFDSFRHQFFDIIFHILEIPILGPPSHRANRSHPSVGLIFSSFKNDGLSGRSEEHTSELQS